ncbi:hypothetical protein B0H15DRAFT_838761 [Mycena belliarum]|uniref:Uncharacterized protein n=1 Tax=Mycena belliarum TaxID=1033014 RepID=A0AAD6U8U9_9AGAR|nr:hypothetical protein B0H15DRAFT_838761 [Mycena belliae]
MSEYNNYPHDYRTDDQDTVQDDMFRLQQYTSHFVPYPEQIWPAPTGDYNISIEGPDLVGPNYDPIQPAYPTTSAQQWPQLPHLPGIGRRSSSSGHNGVAATYMPEYGAPDPGAFVYGPSYPAYPQGQHISPAGSAELLLSPGYGSKHASPHTTPPLRLTPPTSPNGGSPHHSFTASPSPDLRSPLSPFPLPHKLEERTQPLYTHRDQLRFFKDALSLPAAGVSGPFVPQLMYKPHTNSDRRRYVEEVDMEAPIHFWAENPSECGIPLSDALHSRVSRLLKRDETVFEGRGPSVSIRLEWPGYRQWSRQIPTKDFRSPPGPITRAKLAKNVAKCVQRFIQERHGQPMEDDADLRWRVGPGPNQIKLEDLVLVSIHHVSMGSWQPHLRLRRPL